MWNRSSPIGYQALCSAIAPLTTAVLHAMWFLRHRARWFFLKERVAREIRFPLRQLEKRYSPRKSASRQESGNISWRIGTDLGPSV
jgi:hypothetical protein